MLVDKNKVIKQHKDNQIPKLRLSDIEPDELYSVHEVAEVLRLSPSTLRFWIWQGGLPHTRLGRRVFLRGQTVLDMATKGFRPKTKE